MDQLLDVGRYEPELASAGGRQHNSRVQGDRERVEQHDPSVSARFESRDSDHHREPPFAVLIWNAADLLFHHGRYRWYTCHHGSSCLPPTTRAVEFEARARVSQTDSCSRPEVYVSEGYDHTHAQ